MKKLTSIVCRTAARDANVNIPGTDGETNLALYIGGEINCTEVLGEPGVLSFDLIAGSPPAVASPGFLARRRVLYLTYDDASHEEWRVTSVQRDRTGDTDVRIEAAPLWRDLDTLAARRQPAGTGFVDLNVIMLRRNAQDLLDDLMADAPAPFSAGSAGAFAAKLTSLAGIGQTHLQLLKQLCENLACEWEAVGPDVDGNYVINLVAEVGGAGDRPIEFGAAALKNNRVSLSQFQEARDFFSRVCMLGGPDEELVSIAGATWIVSNAVYNGGTNRTTLTLDDDPIYVDGAPGTGLHFGNDIDGFVAVVSTAEPATVVVSGNWAGDSGRFRLASGDDLTFMADPAAEAATGPVERLERRTDIPPCDNLLLAAGITDDFTDWTLGVPTGTVLGGGAIVASTTDERYAQVGGEAALVTADANGYIETLDVLLAPTELHPYFSAWVALRVITGGVRLELHDADGVVMPFGEDATSNADELRGLAIGGLKPAAGNARLRIVATVDDTQFAVDSWDLTNSAAPYDYAPEMGPVALWHAAGRLLAAEGGLTEDAFEGSVFDASYLPAATQDEILIGTRVQVVELPELDFETRVVELRRHISKGESYRKEFKLSRNRADVSWLDQAIRPRRKLAEGITTPTGWIQPQLRAEASQTGFTVAGTDPERRLTALQYRLKTDAGEFGGAWLTAWDVTGGVLGTDVDISRTKDIIRVAGHNVGAVWRALYRDPRGITREMGAVVTFDQLSNARVTGVAATFDATGHPIVSLQGNVDAANMYFRVAQNSDPGTPTGSDYLVAGSTGSTLATGTAISLNQDVWITAIAKDAAGIAGPVTGPVKIKRVAGAWNIPSLRGDPGYSGTSGVMDAYLDDPDLRLAGVLFQKKADANGYGGSWLTSWDASTGTLGVNPSIFRSEAVTRIAGHTTAIKILVQYFDVAGALKEYSADFSFDPLSSARVTSIVGSFDASGHPLIAMTGNSDVVDMYFTLAQGTDPGTPSGASNHIATDSGSLLISSVTVAEETEVWVKGVAKDAAGAFGPVFGPMKFSREKGGWIAPTFFFDPSQVGTNGVLDVYGSDPDLRVTSFEFQKKTTATGDFGGTWLTSWDAATGTVGVNVSLMRSEVLGLIEGHSVAIKVRIGYTKPDGSTAYIGDSREFDLNVIANVVGANIQFNGSDQAKITIQADEDTNAGTFVTVGDGVTPSDPTSGSNDGTVAGSGNGTVQTTVAVTKGNEAIVKVVGYSSLSGPGPVRTFRQLNPVVPITPLATINILYANATTNSGGSARNSVVYDVSAPAGYTVSITTEYKSSAYDDDFPEGDFGTISGLGLSSAGQIVTLTGWIKTGTDLNVLIRHTLKVYDGSSNLKAQASYDLERNLTQS